MIFCYNFFTILFYPIFILIIFIRKLIGKEHKERYKEKILSNHFHLRKNKKKKLIWFHAASVGEVQSIFPILYELKKKNKNLEFLITTVTLSASELIKAKFGNDKKIKHQFFPFDIKILLKKFIYIWSPSLIFFVDSEIWPNFIFEIKRNNIPTIIINGRMTKKSFDRWMLVYPFAKKIFSAFSLCLASSNESKQYLKRLNAQNIKFIGNLKLASPVSSKSISNRNEKFFKNKRVWCAASTHRGEELICLKVHSNLKTKFKDLITVIIPRHIDRSTEIKDLCDRMNLNSQIITSKGLIKSGKEVVIVNTFGDQPKYFKYSKSVFIGKSFLRRLKKVSGQNPIEAAKLDCNIYHGPYIRNFQEIYQILKSHNISKEIKDENDLAEKLFFDLKKIKKKQITNKKIDTLGRRILQKTLKEIDKFIA